jgi:ABC-type sugar transport system ATPase subunit
MSLVISEVLAAKAKALKEVLRMSDCVAVVRDHKRVAECSGSVDDQTLIHTMAGEL